MIVVIIVSIVLIFLAGVFNAKMDYIAHNALDKESWLNKWYVIRHINGATSMFSNYKHWYYFGLHKPKYRERFPLSSTILVFLTDQWHFKKWCMFLCYEFALSSVIVYYESLTWWGVLVGILVLKIVRGLGFTLKYDKK